MLEWKNPWIHIGGGLRRDARGRTEAVEEGRREGRKMERLSFVSYAGLPRTRVRHSSLPTSGPEGVLREVGLRPSLSRHSPHCPFETAVRAVLQRHVCVTLASTTTTHYDTASKPRVLCPTLCEQCTRWVVTVVFSAEMDLLRNAFLTFGSKGWSSYVTSTIIGLFRLSSAFKPQ